MSRTYLDASAAAKLLVEEAESAALADHLDRGDPELVASVLLETELRRLGVRMDLDQGAVTAVLDAVTLYELPPSLYREAGLLAGKRLRTLDAIHVAAANRLRVEVVLTYDGRFASAARAAGLHTLAPGSEAT